MSKYACVFSQKGRSRFLEFHRIYIDGTLDQFPFASICLDEPIVMLDPQHAKAVQLRPHELAKSCDLFTDETCYEMMKLVEEEVVRTRNFHPETPVCFLVAEMNRSHMPSAIIGLAHYEALNLLSQLARAGITAPAPADPDTATKRDIFNLHSGDRRPMRTPMSSQPTASPHNRTERGSSAFLPPQRLDGHQSQ